MGPIFRLASLAATAALTALFVASASTIAINTPLQIGTTFAIKKDVVGRMESRARALRKGDEVHQDETIQTAAESEGEFVLRDGTKLALGPNAELILDRFVYDPANKDGNIVINVTKGAFRFMSGSAKKTAYTIKTPVASIGVRGTVFDGYVDDDGEIAVLLMDGAVDVCNVDRECSSFSDVGYFIHVGRSGVITRALEWNGRWFRGRGADRAFPFVGRRLRIDPRIRFRRADLLGGRLIRGVRGGRQADHDLSKHGNTDLDRVNTDRSGDVDAHIRVMDPVKQPQHGDLVGDDVLVVDREIERQIGDKNLNRGIGRQIDRARPRIPRFRQPRLRR